MVEQGAVNSKDIGSSPIAGANFLESHLMAG